MNRSTIKISIFKSKNFEPLCNEEIFWWALLFLISLIEFLHVHQSQIIIEPATELFLCSLMVFIKEMEWDLIQVKRELTRQFVRFHFDL